MSCKIYKDESKEKIMAQISGKTWVAIRSQAQKTGVKITRVIDVNLTPSSHLAYIIGVLLGDGIVSQENGNYEVSLEAVDNDFVEVFASAMRYIGVYNAKVRYRIRKTHFNQVPKKYYLCRVKRKKILEWYTQLTFKKINKILEDDENKIFAFLRGFYDSEGGLRQTDSGTVTITMDSTEKDLLGFVSYLIKKIGYNSSITHRYSGCKHSLVFRLYLLGITQQKVDFITKIMPSIPRKSLEGIDMRKLPKYSRPHSKHPYTYPNEIRKEAIRRRKNGETVVSVAKKLGVGHSVVSNWTKHLGIKCVGGQKGYPLYTKNKAKTLRQNNYSYRKIAKELNVSNSTVIRWIKDIYEKHDKKSSGVQEKKVIRR